MAENRKRLSITPMHKKVDVSDAKAETRWQSFADLANEILEEIAEGNSIESIYLLLRQVESVRATELGHRNWPGLTLRIEDGDYLLITSKPHVDAFHDARWPVGVPLTPEGETELREHIAKTLRAWLRESDRSKKSRQTAIHEGSQTEATTPRNTTGSQTRPEYRWPKEYQNDKWIYENIHLHKFDDLSVKHKFEGISKRWKTGFSRNQYKARADRFAEYHGYELRRFNTVFDGVNGVSDT